MNDSPQLKGTKKLLEDIRKKYGAGSILDLGQEQAYPEVEMVSTGLPSLDLILRGGIPKGRILEIFGPESSGKTTMALHMLAKLQKECEKHVAYIDIENCFDVDYCKALGLDLNRLLLVRPKTGEEAMDAVEKICQSEECSAVVIDSVAQLVPQAVTAKEIDGTANIATTARLLSQTIPRVSNAASASGTTLIFINQIRMNIGVMYGNPEVTPGGQALKFAASVRLEVRKAGKSEERDGKEGHEVRVKIIKNKLGPPNRTTNLFLIYGEGFDEIQDLLDTALELKIITKAGGWFSYESYKEQGWINFCEKLRQDENVLKQFHQIIIDSKL